MQVVQVRAAQVPQLDPLEVLPHPFVRVEVGRVGRQPLQMYGRRAAIGQVVLDRPAMVNGRAVPDDQQPLGDITPEVAQEEDALRPGQRVAPDERRQLPRRGDAAHRRQVIARLEDPQDGRLAARGVSPDHTGQQVEA